MLKVIIGGVVAGIVFFIWSFLVHAKLPFGRMGITQLPNEAKVLESMKTDVTQDGLYIFPWMDPDPSDLETKAWEEKVRSGPGGVLIIQPHGREYKFTKLL